jgi:nitric oxide reductase large subunit
VDVGHVWRSHLWVDRLCTRFVPVTVVVLCFTRGLLPPMSAAHIVRLPILLSLGGGIIGIGYHSEGSGHPLDLFLSS